MSELLSMILSRNNMLEAYKQVKTNKGSAGIAGITIEQMDGYLRQNWRETNSLSGRGRINLSPYSELKLRNPMETSAT